MVAVTNYNKDKFICMHQRPMLITQKTALMAMADARASCEGDQLQILGRPNLLQIARHHFNAYTSRAVLMCVRAPMCVCAHPCVCVRYTRLLPRDGNLLF